MTIKRAIIGGSGFTSLQNFSTYSSEITTPYGSVSSAVTVGELASQPVYFLPRHGKNHHIPPHKINYRANLYALYELGVQEIIALAAVGAISQPHIDTVISIPHQIIDYTWGREHTFFDGFTYSDSSLSNAVEHIEFTDPYSTSLRQQLQQAAIRSSVTCLDYGVYGVTQGPRLETAAEIDRMDKDGVHLVGMTGMPEAALAKELGIEYACLAMTVNPAAGRSKQQLSLQMIKDNLQKTSEQALSLLSCL